MPSPRPAVRPRHPRPDLALRLLVILLAVLGAVVAFTLLVEPEPEVDVATVGVLAPPSGVSAAAVGVVLPYEETPDWQDAERRTQPEERSYVASIRASIDAFRARKAQEAEVAAEAERAAERGAVWDRLADCESGDWSRGVPQPGTRRWDYGLTFDHGDGFEGGLNFHPGTWDAYREPGMPSHAGRATRDQQIEVAERVLDDQGWQAWPVCSRKLGMR